MIRMIRMIREGYDVVIASRYQRGSRLYGLVSDYTCGYRAYRAAALKQAYSQYGDSLMNQDGFQCMVDISAEAPETTANLLGGAFTSSVRLEALGQSKMNLTKISLQTLRMLWARRLGR